MKTRVEIFIRSSEPVSEVIKELGRLFPEGKKGSGFQLVLSPTDPKLTAVLSKLSAMGVPRVDYSKSQRPKNEYVLEYRREYEAGDDEACSYLQLKHQTIISEEQIRDDLGRLVIDRNLLRDEFQIGAILFNATVISETLRREITESKLVGCEFRDVVTDGRISQRFFELTSSISLPPMSRERLVTRGNTPADYVNVAGIRDGEYLEKEIHYRADTVRSIEPFDFALTHEVFGGERWQIGSQSFRRFCIERDLKLSWIPVRLDED